MRQMYSQPIPGGPAMDPFYSSPFSSYFRRQTPYFGQPDYRIYEMNKRLQQRTDDSDKDGPKDTLLGELLIPRYFRSIFEGGVSDLSLI
ncbi:LIM domain-binding protein 2 [Caerostris extrusa]|uniref:LIM domain-binding protein 2 n=1 Tax=Caerostris extrusa TaxID=172846 RepID=A0AAV4NZZ8_CAEEX|nr:LIM domain-binding protein 2 [Caerostris extrusa]